jgi:hypothetical protein
MKKTFFLLLFFYSASIYGVEIVPREIPLSVIDSALRYANHIDIGRKKNAAIITKFSVTAGSSGGTAWCQSFVYSNMHANGLTEFRTANANSYYTKMRDAYGFYDGEVQDMPGIITWRKPNTNSGHTEFIIDLLPFGFVRTIGGNTTSPDDPSLWGVFVKVRNIGDLGDKKLLGVIQGKNDVVESTQESECNADNSASDGLATALPTEQKSATNYFKYSWLLLLIVLIKKLI